MRPRVLLYSHDSIGLGHIRRTLAVASALADRRPDATLLLVTGADQTHRLALPANLAVQTLPSVRQGVRYVGLPDPDNLRRGGHLWSFRATVILAACRAFRPHLVYVDHMPVGPSREFLPALRWLSTQVPRPRLILGLPDLLDSPERVARVWARDRLERLIEREYDRVLVFGDQRVFDPVAAYEWSPAIAAKTAICGYITRLSSPPTALTNPPITTETMDESRVLPLVVVLTGGGEVGTLLHRAALQARANGLLPGVRLHLVTGPRLAAGERREIEAMAIGLPDVTLSRFHPDPLGLYGQARVVVGMAGSAGALEPVAAGRCPILVPRAGPVAEQRCRAERLTELGLASMIPPESLSPEALAQAIHRELARPEAAAPPNLDFGGWDRAGAELDRLLTTALVDVAG